MNRLVAHPGEILAEELDHLGLDAAHLAAALSLPTDTVERIITRERPVTAEVAVRLSRWLGTSAQMWMDLQTSYDLAVVEEDQGEEIRRTVARRDAA